MAVDPLVEQHWPQLAALTEHLDALKNRRDTIANDQKPDRGHGAMDGQDIVNALREYERRNGTSWRA